MNSENKIAIDIVLLLPKEIIDLCIELNSKYSDRKEYVSLCMGILKKYLTKSSLEDFSESRKIDQLTLDWTNEYSEVSAGLDYRPHITLGVGYPRSTPSLPVSFIANKLAIFQLGPYCTCKKMLAKFNFK